MHEIILSKKAKKFLDKLNLQDRERIINALDKLRFRPDAYLIRLIGEKSYKFRVGDYRLIIDLDNKILMVLVLKIGNRRNIYKK